MIDCDHRVIHGDQIDCRHPNVISNGLLPISVCNGCEMATGGKSKPARPCIHIGDETRRVECPSCSGRVRVKIFACAVHGECAPVKSLDGVACCRVCGEWE